jgi:tartrate dehydratase alpha subunit/fumarate hydratase class I-like protein
VNNYLVAPGDETGVWFTTKMQDSKVVQFAILPSDEWVRRHSEPYKKHDVKTHDNILQIIKEQATNQIKVEVELMFKGSGSKIKGSFVIN